jgi:O-antigen biosynthesis protein
MLKEYFTFLNAGARAALRYFRYHGLLATLSVVWNRYKSGSLRESLIVPKRDIVGFYGFTRLQPIGPKIARGDVSRNTVNWVVPPWGFGSGGHLNIFRFVNALERDGFECRVVVVGQPQPMSSRQAHEQICSWFLPIRGEIFCGIEAAPAAHITIATSWTTAYYVRAFQSTVHKCYFIQDFEPYFYPVGAEYSWAEETYKFGFLGITAGTWLKDKISAEYGMQTASFGFSFDKDLYRQHVRREPDIRRVFFYARPPTDRRAFQLGMLVLDDVVKRLPDVKVIFAGWDLSEYKIPFEHLNCGIVGLNELPDLYSQCDVALVLSFTNLSLLPLELMACGTPVVSNRGDCTEWLLNDDNSRLSTPTVEALADAICAVLNDPNEAVRLRQSGLATAANTDWAVETSKVACILRDLH